MMTSEACPSPAPTVGPLKLLPLGRIVAEAAEPGQVMTLDDLRISSNHLAIEIFRHDAAQAAGHPLEWYRDQWGSELPDQQAATLRRMTIEHCEQQALLERYQAGVVDLEVEERLEAARRSSERLNGASFVLMMAWLFVVVSLLIGYHDRPTADELRNAQAAQPVSTTLRSAQ